MSRQRHASPDVTPPCRRADRHAADDVFAAYDALFCFFAAVIAAHLLPPAMPLRHLTLMPLFAATRDADADTPFMITTLPCADCRRYAATRYAERCRWRRAFLRRMRVPFIRCRCFELLLYACQRRIDITCDTPRATIDAIFQRRYAPVTHDDMLVALYATPDASCAAV